MSHAALFLLVLAVSLHEPAAPKPAAPAAEPGGKAVRDEAIREKVAQENPVRTGTSEDFDEDMIAGHPDGEPPPLPKQVVWSLDKSLIASTPRRQRLSLAGLWRFGAAAKRETPTLRQQMGWIQMPAAAPRDAKVFDAQLRPTRHYQNQPLAGLSWAWCERDIPAPIEWVKHQVFLVIKGPWRQADVFVAYQPVSGVDHDGGRWFEITESLVYGGDAPVALRLNSPAEAKGADQGEPYIGLELLPTGPRFHDLRVRQDRANKQLELSFDLRRPKFILGLPVRLSELPLIVQFRLEDAATNEVIQRFDQNIGPMPQETRTEALRVAWSKPDADPPRRLRLKARLTSTWGGNMDVPYPLEFDLDSLPAAP